MFFLMKIRTSPTSKFQWRRNCELRFDPTLMFLDLLGELPECFDWSRWTRKCSGARTGGRCQTRRSPRPALAKKKNRRLNWSFFYFFLKDGSRTGFRAHFDSVPADSLRMPDPVVGALKLAPPHQGRTLVGGINSNRASVVVYRPAPWDSRTPGGSSRPTRSPCRVDWRRRRCCRRPPDRPSAVPVRLRSDSSQFFFPIPDETGPSFFHRHSTIVIPQPSMQKNNFFG